MTKNIMIVGVGGQGTLLASKILGKLFLTKNYAVKVSEVHGMSQRGGSVVTYVRYGDKVYSPIVDKGEADVIISFELLEAARWVEYLSKDGVLVTNTQQINPMPVITGSAKYPEDIEKKLKDMGVKLDAFDALSLANEAGSSKCVNIVLLGHLSNHYDFTVEEWHEAIRSCVKEKFVEMNLRAFEYGRHGGVTVLDRIGGLIMDALS